MGVSSPLRHLPLPGMSLTYGFFPSQSRDGYGPGGQVTREKASMFQSFFKIRALLRHLSTSGGLDPGK